jgi:hypothetical protein
MLGIGLGLLVSGSRRRGVPTLSPKQDGKLPTGTAERPPVAALLAARE